jgi:hypothetical protein
MPSESRLGSLTSARKPRAPIINVQQQSSKTDLALNGIRFMAFLRLNCSWDSGSAASLDFCGRFYVNFAFQVKDFVRRVGRLPAVVRETFVFGGYAQSPV